MKKIINAIKKEWYETIQFLPVGTLFIATVIAIIGVVGSSWIDSKAKEDNYINAVAIARYYDEENDKTDMIYRGEDGKKYRVEESMSGLYNQVQLRIVNGEVTEVIIYEDH